MKIHYNGRYERRYLNRKCNIVTAINVNLILLLACHHVTRNLITIKLFVKFGLSFSVKSIFLFFKFMK